MPDFGLLLLRVTSGLMMMGHGIGKANDLFEGKDGFPDPLGIGSTLSLGAATFAELLCAALVVLGVKTRLSSVPVVLTMLVAAFVFHAGDEWGDKELAVLYAAAFATLIFTGGGRHSVDGLLASRALQRGEA